MNLKVKDIIKQLNFLYQRKEPVIFIDSDVDFKMKYMHSDKVPVSFYGMFTHEIKQNIDSLLNLDITFIEKKNNLTNIYVKDLREFFINVERGGKR